MLFTLILIALTGLIAAAFWPELRASWRDVDRQDHMTAEERQEDDEERAW